MPALLATTPAGGVPVLQLRGISKAFPGVKALDNIDLEIQRGEIHALLGENGAGKSTLIKILSGIYRPDAGQVLVDGQQRHFHGYGDALSAGIATIYQEFSLIPWLNARENIFLGRELTRFGVLRIGEMRSRARALFARLGYPIDTETPVAELSVAQQQFVEIAKALAVDAHILVLDEPTATLTPSETHHLFTVMRELQRHGVSMIFISHHLEEIFEITDRVTVLRDGRRIGEARTAEVTTDQLVEMMIGRRIEANFPPKAQLRSAPRTLLAVEALQIAPADPVNRLEIRAGEILGFAGVVGSGRTELAMALVGATPAHRKQITRDGEPIRIGSPAQALRHGIGLLPENRKTEGLILDFSIRDNLSINNLDLVTRAGWFLSGRSEDRGCRAAMAATQVKAPSPASLVGELSGGNQQKVIFARWLRRGAQILILDEPTRGVDIGAKAEIYRLIRKLADEGHGIIFISSELIEITGLCDRAAVFRSGAITATLEGEALTGERIMQHATGSAIQ